MLVTGINNSVRDVAFAQAKPDVAHNNAYSDFLASHPEMNDPEFQKDVLGLVEARRISTQEAYEAILVGSTALSLSFH